MRIVLTSLLLLIGFGASATPSYSQDRGIEDFPKLNRQSDWPFWRGPYRNGNTVNQNVPIQFGDSKLLAWQTPIAGRGHGSPIVVGQQVILPTADEKNQVQSIVAIDRRSGKQLWSTELSREGFPKKNHPKNTEATPTVASDGESLYACFFHHKAIHLYKLSLDGKVSYQQNLGEFDPKQFEYGYAPSPCLYKNQVIVCAEYDGKSYLVSLQSRDGKELWRTARPSSISFSTPVVASVAGRDQLLLSGNQKVSSYDPMTGKELWAVDGTTFATCGTMIWEGNTVFASGGFPKAETIAVQADGSGKILWRNDQKCYEQSMIVHQGYVYALTDKGVLYCWQASDGKEMWKQRLQGPVSSSPVLVDNRIYWANESGTMYVFEANPQKYVSLSENKIGDESFASPAVCGNQFFVRTAVGQGAERQEYLKCYTAP
ncbi:MAG: PQQ-binding-like beta-propeller repeat protein [Pirellulales bacterium]